VLARKLVALIVTGAVAATASAAPARAEPFRLTDDRGTVHLTNVPADPRYRGLPGSPHREPAGPARAARPYESTVREAAVRHAVSPTLVDAVIRVESGYDPTAVSPKGASGLMQLMPGTAARLGVADRFDPRESIGGGVRHLRHLLDRYRGDVALALAAYNAGERAVDNHRGIPPYPETTRYVRMVLQQAGLAPARDSSQMIFRYAGPDGALTYSNLPPPRVH
jgi:soluble lytic murein transglycosylase-like protein